jgi:hypothetical protein
MAFAQAHVTTHTGLPATRQRQHDRSLASAAYASEQPA